MKTKEIEKLLQYHRDQVTELVNRMNDYEGAIFASQSRADKTILVASRETIANRLTRQAQAVAHYEQVLEDRKK